MKKITTLFLSLSATLAMAQTIPNANFETWETPLGSYAGPKDWNTFDFYLHSVGSAASVTKDSSTSFGKYAANVRNVKVNKDGTDTTYGGFMFADVDITGKPLPGYLKGYVKYSLQPGDKATIMFGYKTVDSPTMTTTHVIGIKSFEGTSDTLIPFIIPTHALYYPNRLSDELRISVESYNLFGRANVPSSLSNITVDSLSFGGTTSSPVIVAGNTINNGDFTDWIDAGPVKTPLNWFLSSPLQEADSNAIKQSTDAFTGDYALQLGIDLAGTPAAVYTFFKPSAANKFIQGYAKFDLAPKDTVIALLTKYTKEEGLEGESLDTLYFTGSQANYQAFSLSFGGKINTGDTLALQFFAYNPAQFENWRVASSTFLLDDVSLSATPLDLDDEQLSTTSWTVSPNPSANGLFTLRSSQKLDQLQVFDVLGNKVEANIFVGQGSATLDISQHARGIYYVTQQKENSKYTSRIVY